MSCTPILREVKVRLVSTCGVRLLRTNQQLSRELPSLQDEPKIETQGIKVSVSNYFLRGSSAALLAFGNNCLD